MLYFYSSGFGLYSLNFLKHRPADSEKEFCFVLDVFRDLGPLLSVF